MLGLTAGTEEAPTARGAGAPAAGRAERAPGRPHAVPEADGAERLRAVPEADRAERALASLRAGRMLGLLSAGEGHLVLVARFTTPAAVNFLARHARGLICLALEPGRCERLGLEAMAKDAPPGRLPFTVSIEAREGVTTGISAADRARTIEVAIDPESVARDLVQPGHIFPLRADPGGVLARPGHAEAAVDLARLAGHDGAAVVCAVMNDDGTVAGAEDLRRFCARHRLEVVDVAEVADWRRRRPDAVERVSVTRTPTAAGELVSVGYRSLPDERHHVALVRGDVRGRDDVLVHLHPECLTGDVFGSLDCGCGRRLDAALAAIEHAGAGVVVYVGGDRDAAAVPGRCPDGAGGASEIGSRILADLGARSMRLLEAG